MKNIVQNVLSGPEKAALELSLTQAKKAVQQRTAWRIEGTLREFPRFSPVNLWFDFPVHLPDSSGALGDLSADDGFNSKGSPWQKNFQKQKTPEERKKERSDGIETAFEACSMGADFVTISDLADYTGTTEKTVRKRLKEHAASGSTMGTPAGSLQREGKFPIDFPCFPGAREGKKSNNFPYFPF